MQNLTGKPYPTQMRRVSDERKLELLYSSMKLGSPRSRQKSSYTTAFQYFTMKTPCANQFRCLEICTLIEVDSQKPMGF
jgi:hypothetical protein